MVVLGWGRAMKKQGQCQDTGVFSLSALAPLHTKEPHSDTHLQAKGRNEIVWLLEQAPATLPASRTSSAPLVQSPTISLLACSRKEAKWNFPALPSPGVLREMAVLARGSYTLQWQALRCPWIAGRTLGRPRAVLAPSRCPWPPVRSCAQAELPTGLLKDFSAACSGGPVACWEERPTDLGSGQRGAPVTKASPLMAHPVLQE